MTKKKPLETLSCPDSGKECPLETREKGCDGKACPYNTKPPKSKIPDIENKIVRTIQVPFELKEIDDSNEDYFIVSGYAGIFNGIDSYDDRVSPGAYTKTIADNADGLPAYVMHKTHQLPVGLWFKFTQDSKGLYVEARLPKTDKFVIDRLIPQIRVKSVNALSIGYIAIDYRYEDQIRILEVIDLKEISFISKGFQADPGALITDLKKDGNKSTEEIIYNAMVDSHRHNATEGIRTDIIEFYHEKGKPSPFAGDAVISTEELKALSKSNRAFAIRELKLSSNASNFLAGLLETSSKDDTQEPHDKNKNSEESKQKEEKQKEANEKISNAIDELINSLKP